MYMNKSYLEKCYLVIDVEVFVELFFGAIGWLFIFTPYSGISALRCFRIFRYMWYFELLEHEVDEDYNAEDHFFSFTHAAQLCLFYLEQVGLEFFTQKSKGAIVIISILAYITYVFAVVFSTDVGDVETIGVCTGSPACMMTLLRMVLYDGNGLDYLWQVISTKHIVYSVLLGVYMILSAIILLNGLIGVFGQAFTAKDEDEAAKEEEKEQQMKEMLEIMRKLQHDVAVLKNKSKVQYV